MFRAIPGVPCDNRRAAVIRCYARRYTPGSKMVKSDHADCSIRGGHEGQA